jgi:hypothetical protein
MLGWITAATKAETNCMQQKLNMLISRSEISTEKEHRGHCGHWNVSKYAVPTDARMGNFNPIIYKLEICLRRPRLIITVTSKQVTLYESLKR